MYTMGMTGTKWEIFRAAVNLFAKEGYYNVSMNQIAAAVVLRAGAIYNHFSGKDALLEQMYRYYEHYVDVYLPNLEELLEEAELSVEALAKTTYYYPGELQEIMDKIMAVAAAMTSDIRAKLLVQKVFFDNPERYFGTLLRRMIELDIIEPLNVNAFVMLYSCLAHSAAVQMLGHRPVSPELYDRITTMMFQSIRTKTP